VYTTIPIQWNETSKTLTIGQRKGNFPGMLESRTFRIVFVSENHGAGIDPVAQADKTVTYTGEALSVHP
jgi:alpha-D-xyloside xylohydrolase